MPFLAVPALPRPRDDPGRDGPRRRALRATTSTRSTRAFGAGGDLLVLCNPYNPLGRVMEPAELRRHRRRRRPPRRAGASPTRSTPRSSTPATATCRTRRCPRHRRPHRDGDVGVEGVEPARPQVRPADRRQRRRPRPPRAARAVRHQRRVDARRASPPRRPSPHGRPWLDDVARLPRRQPPPARPTCSPSTCPRSATRRPRARTWRGSTAVRSDLPADPADFFTGGGRRGARRRGALRDARPRVRPAQHRPPAGPSCEQIVERMAAAVRAA